MAGMLLDAGSWLLVPVYPFVYHCSDWKCPISVHFVYNEAGWTWIECILKWNGSYNLRRNLAILCENRIYLKTVENELKSDSKIRKSIHFTTFIHHITQKLKLILTFNWMIWPTILLYILRIVINMDVKLLIFELAKYWDILDQSRNIYLF